MNVPETLVPLTSGKRASNCVVFLCAEHGCGFSQTLPVVPSLNGSLLMTLEDKVT